MTLRLIELRKFVGTEFERVRFGPSATVIYGPPNSSKTTTLEMIDYCLGQSDSAELSLTPVVARTYSAIELDMAVGSETHTIRRALQRGWGLLTRIEVDGAESFEPREFTAWLMKALGWPEVMIPKGRIARTAAEVVPLTFRSLLRHIYRREDSWLEFAYREEEFQRRAVTALFLGLTGQDAATDEFLVGETEREISSLEAGLRELDEEARRVVASVVGHLELPTTDPQELEALAHQLELAVSTIRSRRTRLQAVMRASASYEPADEEHYRLQVVAVDRLQRSEREIRELLDGYRGARRFNAAEQERLKRARDGIRAFTGSRVDLCPVCGQRVHAPREMNTDSCWLCVQEVQPDVRERRVQIEMLELDRERAELDEVIERTDRELATVVSELEAARSSLSLLAAALDDQRATFVAPFVSELEDLSRSEGVSAASLNAVRGLQIVNVRREELVSELGRTRALLDRRLVLAERSRRRADVNDAKCSVFADSMNAFLRDLGREAWDFGPVTLVEENLTFYVGTRPWNLALGAEARVLFFLAYHSALLRLVEADGARSPGLAILDNPYQQGLRSEVVAKALQLLVDIAEETNAQVVVSAASDPGLAGATQSVPMRHQFHD